MVEHLQEPTMKDGGLSDDDKNHAAAIASLKVIEIMRFVIKVVSLKMYCVI